MTATPVTAHRYHVELERNVAWVYDRTNRDSFVFVVRDGEPKLVAHRRPVADADADAFRAWDAQRACQARVDRVASTPTEDREAERAAWAVAQGAIIGAWYAFDGDLERRAAFHLGG